jgi:hypothetical protein
VSPRRGSECSNSSWFGYEPDAQARRLAGRDVRIGAEPRERPGDGLERAEAIVARPCSHSRAPSTSGVVYFGSGFQGSWVSWSSFSIEPRTRPTRLRGDGEPSPSLAPVWASDCRRRQDWLGIRHTRRSCSLTMARPQGWSVSCRDRETGAGRRAIDQGRIHARSDLGLIRTACRARGRVGASTRSPCPLRERPPPG